MRRLRLFWIGALISCVYVVLYAIGEADGLGLIGVFGYVVMVFGAVLEGPTAQRITREAQRD